MFQPSLCPFIVCTRHLKIGINIYQVSFTVISFSLKNKRDSLALRQCIQKKEIIRNPSNTGY